MGGKKGFTLVELALSVGFIALLSLTITLIINDTVATYRRGLTLNEITTTGMDLVDDMRSAIQNSPARSPNYECGNLFSGEITNGESQAGKCFEDGARNLVVLQKKGEVRSELDANSSTDRLPLYGAVCTGGFTYIWNSGYFFGENAGGDMANSDQTFSRVVNERSAKFVYTSSTQGKDVEITDFRLLKVKDERRAVCKKAILAASGGLASGDYGNYQDNDYYNNKLTNEFNIANDKTNPNSVTNFYSNGISDSNVEVVLADDVTNQLALYDFTVTPPATTSSGDAAFYSASFILGTVTGGINIAAKGNFCDTPEDYTEDFDYCAINKFNFAAQATGG